MFHKEFAAFVLLLFSTLPAQAGVFTLPRFIEPGNFAIGVEPELTLTNGAGLGGNLKYTHGLTELNNVQAVIGTGGGPRRFRIGGAMTFDFFPDLEGQPGMGVAAQVIYARLTEQGQLEATAVPYVHKAFAAGSVSEVEPYFSFPVGMGFSHGRYKVLATVVVGSMFKSKSMEHIRYNLEVGVAVNNTESYVSGGLTYYH